MRGFKKISVNVFKSIYNLTLNLKSFISHYLKMEEAFKSENIEIIEKIISESSINIVQEPKILIRIEKLNDYNYFYNNGHIDGSGSGIVKDSLVFIKDTTNVLQKYKEKALELKKRKLEEFKKNQ